MKERYPKLLTLQQVIPFVGLRYQTFFEQRVKMSSVRLRTFAVKGVTCVSCGVQGVFFALEKTNRDTSYHLNLYAINRYGHQVLMTRDHIIPRSRGGRGSLDNMQTMCTKCNVKKGVKGANVVNLPKIFEVEPKLTNRQRRKLYAEQRLPVWTEWYYSLQGKVKELCCQYDLDIEINKTYTMQVLSCFFGKEELRVVYRILIGRPYD